MDGWEGGMGDLLVGNFLCKGLIGFLVVECKRLIAFFLDSLLPSQVLIMKQKWLGSHIIQISMLRSN